MLPVKPTVIVAGGPSVTLKQTRLIGMAKATGAVNVIAINDAVYPCWFADIAFATDAKWWGRHNGLPGFSGQRVSVEKTDFPNVLALDRAKSEDGAPILEGFDERPGFIRTGHNSGYGAIHLAANLGMRNIILSGYDFTENGARNHWFGLHEPGMDKHSNVAKWRELLRDLTDILGGRGAKIVNTSPKSTIKWLPRGDLDQILENEIRAQAIATC